MLRKLSNNSLDATLVYIRDNAETLYVCNNEPTTYLEASDTYKLATKANPTFTGPVDGDEGRRELTVNAVTDGVINANGEARFAALVKDATNELVAVFDLNEPRTVDGELVFTMTAHKLVIGLS